MLHIVSRKLRLVKDLKERSVQQLDMMPALPRVVV
jgi:hypothetical protein